VAIAAEANIIRAREALKFLGGRRSGDGRVCLACGAPIGEVRPVRLHGDSFHPECAVYRPIAKT
jgi:hypothetical protein